MDEHAGVLRLMALTLCRPIPTGHPSASEPCWGPPTPPEEVEAQEYAMAHASLEELHEAIGDLKAEWRSRDESRASALDMRRAMDQTAAVISRLRARAVAEPEAVAEELVDLFREDGTLLGAASGRAPRWAAVFGESPIESESAGGGGRVSFEGPPPSREVIINVPALVARFDRGAHVTIASGTNTGKSYLARAIAREMVDTRRVHDVFVLSDDPETAEATYDPVLGDDLEDVGLFSEDELRAIFKRQEEARKEKTLRRTLVIVDDVSGVEKSATLEIMFKRGRHHGVCVMLLNQMANKSMATWAKGNSDFILFSMLTPMGLKDLHASLTLVPPMLPKAFADWAAANVGGAQGTLTRYVFGVYERNHHVLYRVKK